MAVPFVSHIRRGPVVAILATAFVVVPAVIGAINTASTGFQVNASQITIDAHGTCRQVSANDGRSYFVPTKTAVEWSSFWGNKPAGVVLNSCAETLVVKSAKAPSARGGLSCAENSSTGKIYCFGGHEAATGVYLRQIFEYDPLADIVTVKSAQLPSGRTYLSCTENAATHKIYCFGGSQSNSGSPTASIVEYTPATDTLVTKTATLPTARYVLSCAAYEPTGRIYCFGGQPNSSSMYNTIVEYNPVSDTLVTKTATLPAGRAGHSCVTIASSGKIFCLGGLYWGQPPTAVISYAPSTNTVVSETPATWPSRHGLSCAYGASFGNIYCFGGMTGSLVPINEITAYSLATATSTAMTSVLSPGRAALACVARSGSNSIICIAGGFISQTDQIVEYTPI